MNRKSLIAALAITSMLTPAHASLAPWLSVDGQVNIDATAKDSEGYERGLRTQDAEVRFQILLSESLKAVIKFELEQAGFGTAPAENIVEEAYITWNAKHATVMVGKNQMAFGSRFSEDPMFKDNLLYSNMTVDQVVGMTVTLPKGAFGIADTVAMSIFETTQNEFSFEGDLGGSIKATKALTKQIEAQVSAMLKQNSDSPNEKRASVGFVYQSDDGKLHVWAEGIVSDLNENYTNGEYISDLTTWGGRVGAGYKMGPGTIVVEYAYLEHQSEQIMAAYNLPVGQNLVFSPLVRYTLSNSDGTPDDTFIGIRARIQYQAETATRNLVGG